MHNNAMAQGGGSCDLPLLTRIRRGERLILAVNEQTFRLNCLDLTLPSKGSRETEKKNMMDSRSDLPIKRKKRRISFHREHYLSIYANDDVDTRCIVHR